MRGRELLELLEDIRPELIEDAGNRPSKRMPKWLGVAACAVLAVGLGVMGARHWNLGGMIATGSVQAGLSAEQAEDGEAASAELDATGQRILAMELGGLRLGMTPEEVEERFGRPQETSDEMENVAEVSWFYQYSDNPETRYDLEVRMVNLGEGWFVAGITAYGSSDLELSEGIGIGSTRGQVEEQCADYLFEEHDGQCFYSLKSGGLSLTIMLEEERVVLVSLLDQRPDEILYPMDTMDAEDTVSPFSADPITVYEKTDSGWAVRELTGKDAKLVETVMGIEELRPCEAEGTAEYVLDFHNGTIVALYGDDESGAIYTVEDFDPALLHTENWEQQLSLNMVCYFPEGTWDAVTGE